MLLAIIFALMETRIGADIQLACRLLRAGELVAIPTETVYGLAGNALSPDALIKIFNAKNRPRFNPLILHLPSWSRVKDYVREIPPAAERLARQFVPGPLTFLLPKKGIVPDLLTSGSDFVAVRIPDHPLALRVLEELEFPLAAPSANPFGYISPTTAAHVFEHLAGKIPYILDGGACTVGIESTIVGFDESGNVLIYREGGVSREEIERVTGVKTYPASKPDSPDKPDTPGQLKSHYAPSVPLEVGDIALLLLKHKGKRVGIISFFRRFPGVREEYQQILSEQGNINEAASRLFDAMRQLDRLNPELILAEVFPVEGLGAAINDRLSRASAQR